MIYIITAWLRRKQVFPRALGGAAATFWAAALKGLWRRQHANSPPNQNAHRRGRGGGTVLDLALVGGCAPLSPSAWAAPAQLCVATALPPQCHPWVPPSAIS